MGGGEESWGWEARSPRLPQDVEQVVFNNLEAVPESLEVKDWFEEVSLFKVARKARLPAKHLVHPGSVRIVLEDVGALVACL